MASDFSAEPLLPCFTARRHGEEALKPDPGHVTICLKDGVVFQSPAHIFREGCLAATEILENKCVNSLEKDAEGSLHLPLPSVDSKVFETVAIYLENFYGSFPSDERDGDIVRPTRLSCPLEHRELYELSEWEHRFVVQRLLELSKDNWQLSEGGRWVDKVADVGVASEMKVNVHNLLLVLDAASTLDIPPLRHLCAAVYANLLLDLGEREILGLMGVEGQLGQEEEEALLRDYPWIGL
uniref:WGS project CAEQ00000000 data, annotated contig 584 n=1 Tax=Trypanosoma congolense (strain IL3000) TaxID=1068625 RepID=F9WH25_TRYCI|nr:unnamed protein product [Trypanosoma congolense IL3000]